MMLFTFCLLCAMAISFITTKVITMAIGNHYVISAPDEATLHIACKDPELPFLILELLNEHDRKQKAANSAEKTARSQPETANGF